YVIKRAFDAAIEEHNLRPIRVKAPNIDVEIDIPETDEETTHGKLITALCRAMQAMGESALKYHPGTEDIKNMKVLVASCFDQLFNEDKEKAIEHYEVVLTENDGRMASAALRSLDRVTEEHPEEVMRLYELAIKKSEKDIVISEAINLYQRLAPRFPERFLSAREDALERATDRGRHMAAASIKAMTNTLKNARITPIEDDKYRFVKAYLGSPYVEGKTQEQVIDELTPLMHDRKLSFKALLRVLKTGKPSCLEQAIEFASIDIPGMMVIGKISDEGQSSEVYLAEHTPVEGFSQTVALKIMKKIPAEKIVEYEKKSHKPVKDLWINDITNLMELSHENLAKVTDVGEYNGRVYIAQRYYRKGSLEQNLLNINLSNFWRTAEKIIEGVAFLHSKGYVHRDIKPANIFMTGDDDIAVIGDLQTCRKVKEGEPAGQDLLGYTHGESHAAPEVLRENRASFQSDVFSLGLTLVRMYTHPFNIQFYDPKGLKMASADYAKGKFDRDIEEFLSMIPEDEKFPLFVLMKECLAYDPEERPTDAVELLRRFRQTADHLKPGERARQIFRQVGNDDKVMEELIRMYQESKGEKDGNR
ncbi:TPA: serine/threonine protein kinase, partial [Candidatus Woesearchaeota archaeon]|nr:serine/threonine protein kinase [Candidatus Woesearchaeota archaeon]